MSLLYTVTFENGEVAHVSANGVVDAMNLAEVRFGLKAVDAEIREIMLVPDNDKTAR